MTISAQVIDTIVEWIDDNLHQPLRIEEIARHAGYSKWHLQRLFMQYKGESLGRYIRERKLLLAARDLRESDERVYEICLRYGFDSQQTFTRIFTRTFQPAARGVPQRESQPGTLKLEIQAGYGIAATRLFYWLTTPVKTSGARRNAG